MRKREGAVKGWPKIEKRQGGKEARGKEPLLRHGIVGKDVAERIGVPCCSQGCESAQNLV
jgi:hypothetical protein